MYKKVLTCIKKLKHNLKMSKSYAKILKMRNILPKILYTNRKVCYDSNAKKGREHMLTIFDIANWFLKKDTMEQKKLQKLCYYAQSWNLVLNGSKMFDGDFEAWVHGPVNRSLWNKLNGYGYTPIEQDKFKKGEVITDSSIISVLNSVWETYGNFSGYQLELLTHKEKPWVEARGGLSSIAPSNERISTITMREYYSSLLSHDGVSE